MMNEQGHFADLLLEAIERKHSHVVVGLDPDYDLLPPEVRVGTATSEAQSGLAAESILHRVACYRTFLMDVLELVKAEAVAVKIQVAFFEALRAPGYALYEELVGTARAMDLLVIADVKRGDIGSTAEAYARAHLDETGANAVTVNPYFGTDGLEPFLRRARDQGKGVFVLVKTSNPSSAELQDLELAKGGTVYEHVAELVMAWGQSAVGRKGYSAVGAVVGGTHPREAAILRRQMPGVPFLIPGYGAQGAAAADLAGVFDAGGTGAVVNSARAILYAYRARPGMSWKDAILAELREMRHALWRAAGRG